MTYRALLIGNSVFDQDDSLNRLNAPIKDVTRLYRALVDPDAGMFEDENVQVLTEQTTPRIVEELDEFFEQGRRDDLLLLYYSGHGLLNERNRLFLCGRDTRSDRLLRTAVGNTQINDFIEQSMAGTTVVVLDCCSAGMFKAGGPVGDQLAGAGRYVVSSVRGDELANDSAERTGTSLFTEHLVQGLMGGADDVNGDGFVDLREIYDYVRGRLHETSRQRPHCRFDGDGSIHLARAIRPRHVTPPVSAAPTPHTHEQHGRSTPHEEPQWQQHQQQPGHQQQQTPQHVQQRPQQTSQPRQPQYQPPVQQSVQPPSQQRVQPPPQQSYQPAPSYQQQSNPPAGGGWSGPPAGYPAQPPVVARSAQRALSISIGAAIASVLCFGLLVIPWAYSSISKADLEIERSGGRLSGEAELRVARRCARIAIGVTVAWIVILILSAIFNNNSSSGY